jgi:penicillin-binding protein 2
LWFASLFTNVDDTLKLKKPLKKKNTIIQRGYIYDRRKVLVANQASYDIMVIPREVKTDTLEFCQLLNIKKIL